ncbi:MAG TPA: DUF6285 domain-containing protein, partial [Gemmataceae bacterium]|nr:DUF6285 domain-containing protein [Gemmataceae bacterium]
MHDRPDSTELIAAARLFLETELLPALTDQRLRFQTLVAAHVLSIVERELPAEETDLHWEVTWLSEILGEAIPPLVTLADLREYVREANRRLCVSIRHGNFDGAVAYRQLGVRLR